MFRTVHSHPVIDMDKHFIIDPITRDITNAESKKSTLMQNDHNSERFSFEIDRIVEGHDLLACDKIEVHYTNVDMTKKNKSLGVYEVDDAEISMTDENKIVFTWLISQNATLHAGSLSFLITFACVENGDVTYRWNSGVNSSISISKGMNNGEAIEENHPDVLAKWKNDLFAAMYGVETTYVGPVEPETYPYIWFDTSAYYGTSDKNVGVLTIKDAEGNKSTLYPVSKMTETDQSNLRQELTDFQNSILGQTTGKIDNFKDEVTNSNEMFSREVDERINTITMDVSGFKTSVQRDFIDLSNSVSGVMERMQAKLITKVEPLFADWESADGYYRQYVNVRSITNVDSKDVICSPAPDYFDIWAQSGIYLFGISNGMAEFRCKINPGSLVLANLVFWE